MTPEGGTRRGSRHAGAARRPHLPPALRRTLQVMGIILVAHYLILPQLAGVRKSLSVLSDINPLLVACGVVAEAGSIALAAQLARALLSGGERPRFAAVLRVQLATLGLSHVAPGGGATVTPVGFRLFRRAGVSAPNATFVLGAQTVISLFALNVMLVLALIISIPRRGESLAYIGSAVAGVVVLGGLGLMVVGVFRRSQRAEHLFRSIASRLPYVNADALSAALHDLLVRGRQVIEDRRVILRAAGFAVSQWIADAASLWIFIAALGVLLEPDSLMIAFGVANLSAILPLTPGGVGVYEAILTSSLVGFGVPAPQAVIGVLAYRVFQFWLPIPVGIGAFMWAQTTEAE